MTDDTSSGSDTNHAEYVGEYDKLVRDEIPSVVRDDGNVPVTRRVDGREYDRYLAAKLVEEATEYADALAAHTDDDGEDATDELADVHAVVDAILDARDSSKDDVRDRARTKTSERGGFEEGIVLERIERPDD